MELSLADAEVPGLCLGALLEPSQAIPPPFISSVPTAPLRLLFLHAAYLAEWYDRGESKTWPLSSKQLDMLPTLNKFNCFQQF